MKNPIPSQLNHRDWLAIAKLWGELAEIGLADIDVAMLHLRRRIRELVGVDRGFITVHRQLAAPEDDKLLGYRPVLHKSYGPDHRRLDGLADNWMAHEPNFVEDPVIRKVVQNHGRRRTDIQRQTVDKRTFEGSSLRRLFNISEVEDRIGSTLPIMNGFEVTFGFDRAFGSGVFREYDRLTIATIIGGVMPLTRAYLRSYGVMPGQTSLSGRQREVLRYLLGPLSEKEIADRLDLSTGYLHQVVVQVFRRLGVRSRAELMALWI